MLHIGIMGGTFDPIHLGHIQLAEQALNEAHLDRILFMPNHTPWMKRGRGVLDIEHRLNMVRLGIEDHPSFELSLVEIEAAGDSYTYQTLEALKKDYPKKTQLYFIVGADSLFNMEDWVHPELILQNAVILAAVRDGHDKDALNKQKERLLNLFGGEIRLLSMEQVDISSTRIREEFYRSASVREMLPKKVAEYITKNHLYQNEA